MSERVDLQEFIGGFVTEADELVAAANASLLEVETANATGTSRPRAVRDLFRSLHTIKGLAGMIGVEPIVEIAHALETLVRTADRAGGVLGHAAVDVSLQGVAAIAERVRAVAEQRPPAPVPAGLLEAIANTDAGPEPVVDLPPLAPEWTGRLAPGELQQLALALQAGHHVWTVSFAPSEEKAARGITIASVRAGLTALGDIIKVLPRATPGQGSSIAFDILLVSEAPASELAAAAAATADRVTQVLAAVPSATPEDADTAASPMAALDEVETAGSRGGGIGRSVIRVELSRLDELQEQLSLLIVSRFRLEREIAAQAERGHDVRRLREVSALQGRQLRDLRRAILRARMVRVAELLEPLALLVRSLARTGHKEVRLELDARDTELDKTVADRLLPALVHLVRNAVDHAIEPVEERIAKGKPRNATVTVSCTEIGSNRLELVVHDDGCGIDRAAIAARAGREIHDDAELLEVLTTPGFSTRNVVTRTSGRGLGMDIVRRIAVSDLGGELELATRPGEGTAFTLRVPLTIAVVEVFSFECGNQAFVVPVAAIEEIFELAPGQAVQPPSRPGTSAPVQLLERRGRAVPVMSLGAVLAIDSGANARKAIVIKRNGEPMGFTVDRMLGRHEVVVRPVEDPLVDAPGISGATDLGDGRPTLVLDLSALVVRAPEGRAS